MGAVMVTPREQATSAIREVIEEAMVTARNSTLDAVMDIIAHEITLTGDGENCLKRVQSLKDKLNKGGGNGS